MPNRDPAQQPPPQNTHLWVNRGNLRDLKDTLWHLKRNLTENNANQSIHNEEQAKADIYSTLNVNS